MSQRPVSSFAIIAGLTAFVLALRRAASQQTAVELLGAGQVGKGSQGVRAPKQKPSTPVDVVTKNGDNVAKQWLKKFGENELMSEAASVSFYALLSFVPALTAIVSLYGLFADPSSIERQTAGLSGFIPSGGMELITDQIHRLTATPRGGLGLGAVFGLAVALWGTNAATKAMISALNDVYDVKEQRSFIRLSLISLGLSACGLATILISLGALVVLPGLFDLIGLHSIFTAIYNVLRVPAAIALVMITLAIFFRYGPDRRPPRWRWVTWGGAVGAIGWVVLSVGFSWYVAHFGSYNKTYGSLGAVIGCMTWVWLSTTVFLAGAQLNAVIEGNSKDRRPTTGN